MDFLLALAAHTVPFETAEELAPVFLPALVFAGIAAAIFITLAFVSWSFRDVANRHSEKTGDASSHQDTVH